MANFFSFYPPSGGASSNASVGINGTTAPSSSTEIGGVNPEGNLTPVAVTDSGAVLTTPAAGSVQHVIVDSSALPTGAATQTTLAAVSTTLGSILLDMTNGTQITQITGTVPLPTGASTSANQMSEITQLTAINTNTTGSNVAQGSTTAAQVGGLMQGAVTTAAPTYTTGTTDPLSLTTTGALRVDSSASPASTVTLADPLTGVKAQVTVAGSLSVAPPGTELFNESFEGSVIDTTNRWNAPVVAGSGTIAQSSTIGLVITVGTTANNAAALSSQPLFPTQYGSELLYAAGLKLEATTISTGNYRFFGLGTQGASYSTSDPIANGIGFEITTAGILRAVIYASDTIMFSQNLTIPVDGLEHIYVITMQGNATIWYIDNIEVPAAVSTIQQPDITLLPIRYASLNGSSTTTGTPLMTVFGTSIIDEGRNGSQLSDGTYPWRKASVSASGALSTSDVNFVSTVGSKAPGTAATNSQLAGMVYDSTVQTPTNGQQLALQSDAFGNLQTVPPDMLVTGAAAQTATVNNILTIASGSTATNLMNYKSASVQVISTGTAGTFIFEGSNDNVNFQAIPVFNQLILTGTPITTAITAIASQLVYSFPITTQYVRLRIVTTITGGSIQAFSRFMQNTFTPAINQIANATAANLTVTATVASGTITTVSAVTSANLGIPGTIIDVASAAIITTTTTAALTPTFGTSYTVDIPVTVVSGTTPTMVVQVQESADSGTNWYTVYTFPVIIAVGSYVSPVITLQGNRVRYVQTITGTTPSFTRAINRLQSSQAGYAVPSGTIYTDRSGNATTSSAQVAPFNPLRRYLIIQNLSSSNTIYINFTSAATTGSGSLPLLPFAAYAMESNTISIEPINVIASVASTPFTCKEG